jgi:hypothetical protein
VPENGIAALIFTAVSHVNTEASKRAVNLIGSVLIKHKVSVSEDLYPGLLELLQVPEFQCLALSILEKVRDPSILANLLLCATEIIKLCDPVTLKAQLHQYLYQADGWMDLPLFVNCAMMLDNGERQKLGIELTERVIQDPEHFATVKHWFLWLFKFFNVFHLERDRFAAAFTRLINQTPFFAFLAARNDTRWRRYRSHDLNKVFNVV